MPHYPQDASGIAFERGTYGSLTAAATHTKGAYVQIIASVAVDSNEFVFVTSYTGANGTRLFFYDIALGAAGSEVVVIPNMIGEHCLAGTHQHLGDQYTLPLAIPAGSRVAVRMQTSNLASVAVNGAAYAIAAGDTPGIQSFASLGTTTVNTRGTQLEPGGTANTKGAYAELTASTSAVYQFLLAMVTTRANSAPSSFSWFVDIATGAAGSEVVLLADLATSISASPAELSPNVFRTMTYIPSSTRIAARAQCSGTDATDRIIDVALEAGTAPSEGGGGGGGGGLLVHPGMTGGMRG